MFYVKTKILALWDRSRHDIGSYKDEWHRLRSASRVANDAAYAAYDAAAVAAVVAGTDDVAVVAVAGAHAAHAGAYASRIANDAAHAAYVAAVAYAAADDDDRDPYWFIKHAEEKMDVLRETGETK